MAEVKYARKTTPTGTRTLHTDRLVVRSDGKMFIFDSTMPPPVPLDDEDVAALKRHFGSESIEMAQGAMRDLK